MKERWVLILRHIVNVLEWSCEIEYFQCAHDPNNNDESRSRAWLHDGSNAHKALQNVVLSKRLLEDLDKV